MATKSRAADEGRRAGYRFLTEAARALRDARIAAGLSQARLGAAVGVSRATVSRYETGRYTDASAMLLARVLRVLGQEMRFLAVPVGSALRDAGHVKLLKRLIDHIRHPLAYLTDAPLPNPGDRRAWDVLLRLGPRRMGIDAETRLYDLQDVVRRLHSKRRDGMVDGVVLVLADIRHNRELLPALEAMLPEYPRLAKAAFLRTLDAGHLPPDGIVLL